MMDQQSTEGHIRAPRIASIPRSSCRNYNVLVIVHRGKAVSPPEGLKSLLGFNYDGHGGWIAAAQADNEYWGYINAEGCWLVPPTLEYSRSHSDDGLARFLKDGLWGFVNLEGQVVISPGFLDTRPFRDGICAVEVSQNNWRIINSEGHFTCENGFYALSEFGAGGLACALQWDRDWNKRLQGFVDRNGNWLIAPRFRGVLPFEDLPVTPASLDGDIWGLIDTRGDWVLQPCHQDINAFNSDGLAFFRGTSGWNDCGYLNAQGHTVAQVKGHLSARMACGVAVSSYNGSSYLRADGATLPAVRLVYGSDFRSEGRFAIVRTAENRADGVPARWGLLHTDGRICMVDDSLLEPLTDEEGWLADEQNHTPLVPFLTHDGQIAWIDGEGAVVWRVIYDSSCATLLDADGNCLWRSVELESSKAPAPFFLKPAADYLEGIVAQEDINTFACTLMADAEKLLHQMANGDALINGSERDDDDDDDDEFVLAKHTGVVCRIARGYLSEEHNGPYEFMAKEHSRAVNQLHEAIARTLTASYGTSEPDPEHVAPRRYLPPFIQSWAVPLERPLADDSGILSESREQWLTLYYQADSGDGDMWWELWLMAAPSRDAFETARRMRAGQVPVADLNDDEEEKQDGEPVSDEYPDPRTREEWFHAVSCDRYAIARVPSQWLDDEMVGAAISHDIASLTYVPGPFQTFSRLEAWIRLGVSEASHIPCQCMTAEGLALARRLYGGQPEWDWNDERKSRIPTLLDHDILNNIWGALLTPEMALMAVEAKAPLCDLAHWLRTDEVEMVALKADIYNISYVDKAKITPELARRAVVHNFGCLIEYIPAELITHELCLASARVNGLSLKVIPEQMRSIEICVTALKDSPGILCHVPEVILHDVTTRLIEDDLTQALMESELREGSHWHVDRAWAKLRIHDYEGAIADAHLGLPHILYKQNAHYIISCACIALGQEKKAALEASNVLSYESPYSSPWNDSEDTQWLHKLVLSHAGDNEDDATLAQLRQHPRTLGNISRERITSAMVETAVAADEEAVCFVPRRLMTPALYTTALRQNVKHFEQIPSRMLSEEACIVCVENDGWRLKRIPEHLRTLRVCAYAIRCNSGAIKYAPEALHNQIPEAIRQLPSEDEDVE